MKRTLTNLWNGYFRAKIFVNLSPSADRLFLGVLNKANEMGFPDTFSMANSEAMANGNIKSEPTLYNRRNELADYTFMNEWLLRYEKGEVDHCGEYEINYDLLLKYSQVFLNNANGDSQNLGKNESELPSGSKNLGKNESRPEVDSQNLVNNESENGCIQENDSQNLGKNEYINRSDQKRIDKNNRSLQKISFNSKKSEEEKKEYLLEQLEMVFPNARSNEKNEAELKRMQAVTKYDAEHIDRAIDITIGKHAEAAFANTFMFVAYLLGVLAKSKPEYDLEKREEQREIDKKRDRRCSIIANTIDEAYGAPYGFFICNRMFEPARSYVDELCDKEYDYDLIENAALAAKKQGLDHRSALDWIYNHLTKGAK